LGDTSTGFPCRGDLQSSLVTAAPLPIPELLQQARAGDAGALQTLLQRYREFIRLVVRCHSPGQLRARVDSSDLVQETLLQAAQHIGQFQGHAEEEWRAWLGRIAQREVIHQARRHFAAAKRARSREQPLPNPRVSSVAGLSRLDQWLARSQTSPSLAAMRHERAVLLSEALARLPEDSREVLVLRHLEGLGFPEVGERMGRSAGAVRVLWVRALKRLREEIDRGPQLDSRSVHE
jgi:RNA polymerase sigma-70 factor (ECF subfamily)